MQKFTEQFNQILNYADILQKINTEGYRADSSCTAD
jgi:Asp-tRNA(Asn)/Glu-tRNA(Gln) amidotransferase C subunit